MSGRLDGKVAVITGGCSGIGLATVRRFVAEGAKVVVGDLNDEAGAALSDELGIAYVRCDVTSKDQVDSMFATAKERFGSVDIAFNNAGISPPDDDSILETELDAWRRVQEVNLTSVYLCCKAALPYMIEQGKGSIINTASLAGMTPGAGVMSYRVAKAGVIHFTRCLALEVAEHGIRANVVAPANIATAINAQFDMGRTIEMTQPLARHGEPGDAAQAVLFLASDRSAQITGTVLPVDGGTSVGIPVQRMAEIMAVAPAGSAAPTAPAGPVGR